MNISTNVSDSELNIFSWCSYYGWMGKNWIQS